MSELPKGWFETTVGILSQDISYGFTTSASSTPNGPKFLRITDIQNGTVDWTAVPYCKVRPSDAQRFLLKTGDIVFARTGATTGKSFLIRSTPEAVFASYLIRLRPSACILPELMACFFQSHSYWQQVTENLSGSAQPNCNATKLSSLKLPVPPLNEQRRIVAKLEKLLGRVDAAQARLANISHILKRFRQSVLAAACSGRLTADWREQVATEAQTGANYILANGDIPSSWQKMSVEQIAKIGSGQSSAAIIEKCTAKGEVGWFKVSDMNSQGNEEFMRVSQNYLRRKDVEELRVKVFPKGSIIFPKRGGAIHTNKKRILIEPSCLDLNLMALILDEGLRDYFWVWFSTINLGSLSDGSNVPQINNTDILPLEVPLPPLPEQQEIVRRVEALFKTADALEARYLAAKAHVDKLTQSILAKAFRGELVPQDPNDEPASVLLDRIREEKRVSITKKKRTYAYGP